jgi:hypothetical protein
MLSEFQLFFYVMTHHGACFVSTEVTELPLQGNQYKAKVGASNLVFEPK